MDGEIHPCKFDTSHHSLPQFAEMTSQGCVAQHNDPLLGRVLLSQSDSSSNY